MFSNNITCDPLAQVTITVWPVTGSPARPDESGDPLGVATITADQSGFLNSMLAFPQSIPMPQHSAFALVLSFSDDCTGQDWPVDNYYRHGDGWIDDGLGWVLASAAVGRADVPMTTFVLPPSDLRFLSSWRSSLASATLADGKVLLLGSDNTAEVYDPVTNTLTMTGNMASNRSSATATLLTSGKVLIVGGNSWNGNTNVALATTELFDPNTNTFSAAGTMAQGRYGHTATVLSDGKVLITGGWSYDGLGNSQTLDSAVVFDAAGVITATPTMTGARVRHTATLLSDDRVLVVGGWSGPPFPPTVAEIYDPTVGPDGTFTQVAAGLSVWPSEHTATRLTTGARTGHVLIAGGPGNYPALATTGQFFDPGTSTFSAAPGLIVPRLGHTATPLGDGRIAFAGGVENWQDYVPGTTVEIYDPVADQFTIAGDLITDRSSHIAELITVGPNTGKLAVAGGHSSGSIAGKTIEVFDLSDAGSALMIAPQTLPDGVTGQSYTSPPIGASGGSGIGYSFTLAWGEMPPGLSVGPNGTISGTPTSGGPASFVVKVTDSAANEAYRGFTITVDRLAITTGWLLPNGFLDGFYSYQLAATGAGAITWSLEPGNTMPTGLSLSSSGLLSGTTSVAAGWYFNVRATDTSGQSTVRGFSLQVVTTLGFFQSMGPMTAARYGHVAEQLASGLVLLAGSANFLTSAELYDPSNGSTVATGSLGVGRCYGCSVAKLTDGKILVAGGYDGSSVLNSAEYYNPSTGTFAPTAGSMTTIRLGGNAVRLPSNKVLILGGHNGFTPHDSAELYDPAPKTFSATGTMSTGRTGPGAALLGNGKVLVAGGQTSSGIASTAEIYDPGTGLFSGTGSMISARQVDNAVVLPDGRVLIAGGNGPSGALAAAETYDPLTGLFTSVGAMNTARRSHSVVRLTNGLVLVLGGEDDLGNFLSSAEVFDPVTNTFTVAPSMWGPRSSAKVTLLVDGRVLITGGYSNTTTMLSSVEVYVP